ncbi:MAG: helix-turn-helix domain-containing protein [Rhodoferax sp.]
MPKKPELSAADQAIRERIGATIRSESGRLGKKPIELATAGGVSLANQYRIESGEATPDVLYLLKVTALLGMTMDELCLPSDLRASADITQTASSGGVNVGGANSGAINTGSHSVQQNFHKEVKGDVVGRDKIVQPPSSTREKPRNGKR